MATRTKTVRRNAERKRALPATPKAGSIELANAPGSLTQEDAKKLLKGVIKASKAVGPLKAINTNLTSELNNIDFKKMIGGPLQACVDAQVASSLATINFINEVGFKTTGTGPSAVKELIMVDFSHKRNEGKNADGTDNIKDVKIRIPLIAMLPIPSLRIDHVTIDFNVKLNSVETSQVSSAFDIATEVKGGWGPVSFKVSASYQRKSTTGVEVKKEYALNVNVKAVQDEIPAGLEKILNMLAA